MNLLFEDMSSQVETKSDEGRTKIFDSTFLFKHLCGQGDGQVVLVAPY